MSRGPMEPIRNWDGRTYQGFIHSTRGEWGLYMAPEVRELLRWGGGYQGLIRGTRDEWVSMHGTRSEGAVGVGGPISGVYMDLHPH